MRRALLLAWLLVPVIGVPQNVAAGELEAARALVTQGKNREAVAALKALLAGGEQSREASLLLAKAYAAERNFFWAQRSLAPLLSERADCEAASWLAWLQLEQGLVDLSRATLGAADCPFDGALATRQLVLDALVARQIGDEEAAEAALESARIKAEAFAADRAALVQLSSSAGSEPLALRFELSGGWSSNGRAGSPVDPVETSASDPSTLGELLARARLAWPGVLLWRPAVALQAGARGLGSKRSRDLSTASLEASPSLTFAPAGLQLTAAYRFDALLLAGGDRYEPGPLWFHAAHRGELELQKGGLDLFAVAGERRFREQGRGRLEVEAGGGFTTLVRQSWRVVTGMTLRRHDARNDAYDLWGAAVLVSLERRLPAGWAARAGVLGSFDSYPSSTGFFIPEAERRDWLGRVSTSLFTPRFFAAKLGISYELAHRSSSAPAYVFTEHRVLVRLLWSAGFDPGLPRSLSPAGHVSIDYRLGDYERERIQDLLRQDEARQRSSSCLK